MAKRQRKRPTSAEVERAVARVLRDAPQEGGEPVYLFAFQILDRLSTTFSRRLIRAYGPGGRGNGKRPGASGVVKAAAMRLGAEHVHVNVEGLEFYLEDRDDPVAKSGKVYAAYRLNPEKVKRKAGATTARKQPVAATHENGRRVGNAVTTAEGTPAIRRPRARRAVNGTARAVRSRAGA